MVLKPHILSGTIWCIEKKKSYNYTTHSVSYNLMYKLKKVVSLYHTYCQYNFMYRLKNVISLYHIYCHLQLDVQIKNITIPYILSVQIDAQVNTKVSPTVWLQFDVQFKKKKVSWKNSWKCIQTTVLFFPNILISSLFCEVNVLIYN